MKDKYLVVKKYMDEYDYESLLELGAPDDEYDIESRVISRLITKDNSVEEIAEVIARVMKQFFSYSVKELDNSEVNIKPFLEAARKIKLELQN